MNKVDIDLKKQEILVQLSQLEQDCGLLLERIPILRESLSKVKTLEDAEEFDKEATTLGDGLQILDL